MARHAADAERGDVLALGLGGDGLQRVATPTERNGLDGEGADIAALAQALEALPAS